MKKKVLISLLALSMVVGSFEGMSLKVNANEPTLSEISATIEEAQCEESKEQTEKQLEKREAAIEEIQKAENQNENPEADPIVLTDVKVSAEEVTYDNMQELAFDLYVGNHQFAPSEMEDGELLIGIEKEDGDPYYLFYWSAENIKYDGNCMHVVASDSDEFNKYDITPGEWKVADIMYETSGENGFYFLNGSVGEKAYYNCEYRGENKINVDKDIVTVNGISFVGDKTTYNRGESGVVKVNVTNNTDTDITYGNEKTSFLWGASGNQNMQVCSIFMRENTEDITIKAKESKDVEVPFTVDNDLDAGEYLYYDFSLEFQLANTRYAIDRGRLFFWDGAINSFALNIPDSVLAGATMQVTDKPFQYKLGEDGTPASFLEDGKGKIQFEDGKEVDAIIPRVEYVELSKTSYTYNGKTQKPTVTLVADRSYKELKNNEDYTVSYSNDTSKKVGIYGVKVELAGCYAGEKYLEYRINPKGTSISKVKAGKKKAFTVTWKKQKTQTTGYQIQYSKDKTFSSGVKTVTVKNNKLTSKSIKASKKGTYYVRIRTYKKVPTGNCYSSWSKVKSVKVK